MSNIARGKVALILLLLIRMIPHLLPFAQPKHWSLLNLV